MRKTLLTSSIAALLFAGAASAETMATAGTDLNVRSGPGVQHEVIGSIPSGKEATIVGCIEEANWCQVSYKDGDKALDGWAYGDYLTTKIGDKVEPIYPHRQEVGVAKVEYKAEKTGEGAAVGSLAGAAAGALIAGPIGAAVGAMAGGVAGDVAEPNEAVTTYVTTNKVEPIYLDGEVVMGAGIPDSVTLHEIPDSDYRYLVVNGQTVLVEPGQRKVVYIYR